eukprot:TRINITY_DN60090_c0_g1_i1.p1 TRINITY_DN60090_c0_g1~~TRINITY_DN60090_c0_g1_i1.p1  ORF type:complete len:639 (+),score=219.23 TRINITY_DN60090_c0_g1_i1:70-1917(+)
MGRYSDRLKHLKDDDGWSDEEVTDAALYVPLSVQRAARDEQLRQSLDARLAATGQKREREEDKEQPQDEPTAGPRAKRSLLELSAQDARERKQQRLDPLDERQEVENNMLSNLLHDGKDLRSVFDRAHDIRYTERMPSSWRLPRYLRDMPREEADWIRGLKNVIVEGEDVPPPLLSFRDLRGPPALVAALKEKGIVEPTPIQQQGLTVALSGRDMIGVAFTGSGKTLVFVLPMLLFGMEEERRMPLAPGEGPIALSVAPSRELARQTYEVYCHFASAMRRGGGPELRGALCVGGQPGHELDTALRRGLHAIIATPGRLIDNLKKKRINMDLCRLVCLDEADRMVDMGFEEEVKEIYQHFRHQRQTVMFSATMPKKIQHFAMSSLTDPITVNVNRAGAANLDVVQEVEYVKQDSRILYLLECLQKTPPPVLVFAEGKQDVDTIHEYLLLKCVDAVSIHGGKDQSDRNEAIRRFKSRSADVLVATDIASKGLDFPDVQHVVNYDLPKEIENYVHRIGRTGRCGKTGLATTFVNRDDDETTLLDLKHLLVEARQKVPPVLQSIHDPLEELYAASGKDRAGAGCQFCGGLGHTVSACPKLQGINRQQMSSGVSLRGGEG